MEENRQNVLVTEVIKLMEGSQWKEIIAKKNEILQFEYTEQGTALNDPRFALARAFRFLATPENGYYTEAIHCLWLLAENAHRRGDKLNVLRVQPFLADVLRCSGKTKRAQKLLNGAINRVLRAKQEDLIDPIFLGTSYLELSKLEESPEKKLCLLGRACLYLEQVSNPSLTLTRFLHTAKEQEASACEQMGKHEVAEAMWREMMQNTTDKPKIAHEAASCKIGLALNLCFLKEFYSDTEKQEQLYQAEYIAMDAEKFFKESGFKAAVFLPVLCIVKARLEQGKEVSVEQMEKLCHAWNEFSMKHMYEARYQEVKKMYNEVQN